MSTLLYLSASQFSGTTLLSFLLNQHPQVATIGHTMGWSFDDPDEFRCSCGERIADCPLFRHVADAYRRNNLEFRPHDFGTAFRVTSNPALNYYLTEALPKISTTWIERFRDFLVQSVPRYRTRLRTQMLSNSVLINAVLDYWGATCFLDNSHSPYRMRRLATEAPFGVFNLHMLRDPRGVSLSLMRNSGLSAENAIRVWLKRQQDILRISRSVPNTIKVRYEELCSFPDKILNEIYLFIGVDKQRFTGNFKDSEHHILGNRMRLSDGAVQLDEKWRREMTDESRNRIDNELIHYVRKNPSDELTGIVKDYIELGGR